MNKLIYKYIIIDQRLLLERVGENMSKYEIYILYYDAYLDSLYLNKSFCNIIYLSNYINIKYHIHYYNNDNIDRYIYF